MHCLRPLLIIDAAHLKGQYKGTNLVVVGMNGNNQIVPIAFGIYKGETGLCWSWWMSVLKECIGDSLNLQFIFDRHAAIALAVHNEFLLAFHDLLALKLAETYRVMVQEWYFKRRELADNMTSEITEWVANKVNKKRTKSATGSFTVLIIINTKFQTGDIIVKSTFRHVPVNVINGSFPRYLVATL
ncbi:transposase, MuDR, MULE transposase domain protein [Tanacetum coccineum]